MPLAVTVMVDVLKCLMDNIEMISEMFWSVLFVKVTLFLDSVCFSKDC